MAERSTPDPAIRALALDEADRLTASGACAVLLTGSHVSGRAGAQSDVDLYAIGSGPAYSLHLNGARLVSVSWCSPDEVRAAFVDPGQVGQVIPGWRNAWIIADTSGVAAALQQEAIAWSWDLIGAARLDAWVAEEVTGFAEEVHKLISARGRGDVISAAVQRSILALRLAPRLAVHHRWLYQTENALWAGMNERLGSSWTTAQLAALGISPCTLDETLDAALDLFALAVSDTWRTMDERQREVCRATLAVSTRRVPKSAGHARGARA